MAELKKKFSLKVIKDLFFSVGGLVAMNGVIQLLLYPSINRRFGDAVFGDILSMLAVVSVLATAIGTGANYARMVAKTRERGGNGDFNIFLLVSIVPTAVVSVVSSVLILGQKSIVFNVLFILLTFMSILRYYGDVEYRLNVNFVLFFVYYLLISLGYVAGSFLIKYDVFGANSTWVIAILFGELLSVLFVALTGSIFKGRSVLQASPFFWENMKTTAFLLGSNFINALVLQADKLLLKAFVSSEAVTIFYVATLIGKVIAMLTTPLNGIIIGYLARYKGRFTAKFFTLTVAAALAVCALFTAGGVLVSHIFVKLMYPGIYAETTQYFPLANCGQVFYFVSGSLMVVVLRFAHEKYQLITNIIYAALFAAVVIPFVIYFGIWGITVGLLIVNVVRFIIVTVIGFAHVDRGSEAGGKLPDSAD
ncbi:MAG: hypothetical protein ILO53_03780 [Clostridia bacterium]|nr:hypothetical protein [Clostridia bacterium]